VWILDSIYIVGTTDVFDTSIFFKSGSSSLKKRKRTGPRFPVQFVQLELDLELRRFQFVLKNRNLSFFFHKSKELPNTASNPPVPSARNAFIQVL
jgi:hypothetical protein